MIHFLLLLQEELKVVGLPGFLDYRPFLCVLFLFVCFLVFCCFLFSVFSFLFVLMVVFLDDLFVVILLDDDGGDFIDCGRYSECCRCVAD